MWAKKRFFFVQKCEYAANIETAVEKIKKNTNIQNTSLQKVETPDIKTIEQLAKFLEILPEQTIKAVMYDIYDHLPEDQSDKEKPGKKTDKKENKKTGYVPYSG